MGKTINPFVGQFAKDYELQRQVFPLRDLYQNFLAESIARFMPDSEEPIRALELGVGTGVTTEAVLKRNPNLVIEGVDISWDMLNMANSRLERHGFGKASSRKVRFFQGDLIKHLKREVELQSIGCSEKFDIVYSAYTLHNLKRTKRKQILRGVHEVLKEGGQFFNLDLYYSDDKSNRQLQERRAYEHLGKYAEMGRPDLTEKWREHLEQDTRKDIILTDNQFLHDLVLEGKFQFIYQVAMSPDKYGIYCAVKKGEKSNGRK